MFYNLITLIYLIVRISAHSHQDFDESIRYYEYIQPDFRVLPSNEDLKKLQRRDQIDINHDLNHNSRLTLNIKAYNQTFKLYLEPSTELIHQNAKFITHGENEKKEQDMHSHDYLIYKGFVINENKLDNDIDHEWIGLDYENEYKSGWASIMVHPTEDSKKWSFQGTFTFDNKIFNIKPIDIFNSQRKDDDPFIPKSNIRSYKDAKANTVVYHSTSIKHNESKRQVASCGNTINHNININKNQFNWLSSSKLLRRNLGSNYGCDMKKRVLYMGVVADCNYVAKYKTPEAAKKQIIQEWNTVSRLYENTFNVKIGIIKIEANSDSCPNTPTSDMPWNRKCAGYGMEKRLSDFSTWRVNKGKDSTGLWHLMTDCKDGTQVGLAYVGTLCASSRGDARGSSQGDTGTGVSSITDETWKVVAHEIGHNFGASHDCISSSCPCSGASCPNCCPCEGTCDCGGKYIMNPSNSPHSQDFSPCSLRDMCTTISASGSCLSSSGSIPTYSEAMCGNGIKENGEDCDCGGESGCKGNDCCDAKTCKFKNGAQCDDQNDACCDNCKVKPSGIVCRKKSGECDIEETCDGKNGACPVDTFISNGTPCNSTEGDLKCANGICTSRDLQCEARSKGSNMILKKACDNFNFSPCKLSCAAPGSAFNCFSIAGEFADGTQCGNNQYCDKGECKGGNFFDSVATWFLNNKILAIIIGVAVGLILLSCICSCACRSSRAYKTRIASQLPPPRNTGNQYPLNGMNTASNFVDPTAYNGPVSNNPPYQSNLQPHIGPGGFVANANRPAY